MPSPVNRFGRIRHYIQRALIRNWSDNGQSAWVQSAGHGRVFHKNIRRIFSGLYFYPDFIEQSLFTLEQPLQHFFLREYREGLADRELARQVYILVESTLARTKIPLALLGFPGGPGAWFIQTAEESGVPEVEGLLDTAWGQVCGTLQQRLEDIADAAERFEELERAGLTVSLLHIPSGCLPLTDNPVLGLRGTDFCDASELREYHAAGQAMLLPISPHWLAAVFWRKAYLDYWTTQQGGQRLAQEMLERVFFDAVLPNANPVHPLLLGKRPREETFALLEKVPPTTEPQNILYPKQAFPRVFLKEKWS